MKLTIAEIQDIYLQHNALPRRERGQFIRTIATTYRVDPSTLYRAFDKLHRNVQSSRRIDKGIPRKGFTLEEAKEYVKKVAAAKVTMATKYGRTGETGRIVKALYNAGQLPCIIPTSTVNRWLNWFGFSYRQIANYKKSTGVRLYTDAPNRWWFVDASVSELYYLSKSNKLIRDTSGILTDKNHREEILTKKGYRKLLLFAFVDLYSSAYYINAYVAPGESAAIWVQAFFDAMQEKNDPSNPFRGIPENVYADPGSGLKSHVVNELLGSLGIKMWTHFPGNARAKAKVEARIGAYKQTIERYLAFEKIESLERYRELAHKMMIADNYKKGYYQKWMEIYTLGTLREFDPALRSSLGYSINERQVNIRGCIKINNIEYFVSRLIVGENVTVYTLPDGTIKAVDRFGNVYHLTTAEHQYKLMGKSRVKLEPQLKEYEQEIEALHEKGKQLKQVLKPEHFIEEKPENIVPFNKKGTPVNVTTPFQESPITTVYEAWYKLYVYTGFAKKTLPADLVAKLDWLFKQMIATHGSITRELFCEVAESITDSLREVAL